MHLHCGGHALHQPYAIGHHVKMDPYGNALGKPHPCEDRVHIGNASGIGLRIRHVNGACETIDMPLDFLWDTTCFEPPMPKPASHISPLP